MKEQLFWTVYKFEKGLALRLGRSSNLRDSDITLPRNPNEPRSVRLGCLQGKVYDQLFSAEGLSRPNIERQNRVAVLAGEIRGVIEETRAEALVHPPYLHNVWRHTDYGYRVWKRVIQLRATKIRCISCIDTAT